jgi:hypothetical protein
MSVAQALKAARAAGIQLGIDGNDLVLEVDAPPPAAVLDLLSRYKTDVIEMLRPADDGWSAEDWQAFLDERAGIAEFDGGLPRAEACGDREHAHGLLLPYGIEPTGHAWLHGACWPAWHRAREAEAIAALSSMGIRA